MLAMFTNMPRGELLKAVHLPVLVFHGELDPAFPLEHEKRLADCLKTELIIIPDMGHILNEEDYKQLVKSLRSVF